MIARTINEEVDYEQIINGRSDDTVPTTTALPEGDTAKDFSEDESDDEPDAFPALSLKEDSEKYVITTDNIPLCYTPSLETARTRMWDFARHIKSHQSMLYRCYLREGSNRDCIQLVGPARFFVVSYDRILANFAIHQIRELEEVKDTASQTECTSGEEESRFTSLMKTITG